ncbi:protein saal1 isoform X2 [Kryptolebias marmoratus]|uniref:protein saal1 isoform X2 n=1 Tax=Kryptolebias marmoratus TaxID=37003 RepID=UPI0018ACB2F5|nr:protein saal1 isoform X2 [Kryptolebias marmoratus]
MRKRVNRLNKRCLKLSSVLVDSKRPKTFTFGIYLLVILSRTAAMDSSVDGAGQEEPKRSSPQTGPQSPGLDRNPSPPPDKADGEEEEDLDAIGDTVYSKHWLFSTLTRLINMVAKHSEENSEGQMQLSEDDEEDLCKVWDMAMDKDVASVLQEFKVADILLGVIAKSRCPRLTEICVGILGNVACFPDTCVTLSQNEDLGQRTSLCVHSAVLLLLLGDADPPTLLETSRLLLMCLSQRDVCSLWLQRIRQQTSVCSNLCFIMCSSTNTDLLEKVGELVDKLFDLDEELMKSWITFHPRQEEDGERQLDVTSCLLEAAKQLRSESPAGVEVYLHILQLLTTVKEGLQAFAAPDGPGKSVWDFVCDVVCEDVCQTNDLSVVFHEWKSVLVQTFSVLQALYRCQDQWGSRSDASLPLIGTVFQVCQYHSECKDEATNKDDAEDEQLQALDEITAEFLADLCSQMSKDTAADLIKNGYLTEKTCLAAASCLLPNFKTSFQHLQEALSEVDPHLADVMRTRLPV